MTNYYSNGDCPAYRTHLANQRVINRYLILFTFCFCLVVIFAGGVFGAECGATPTDNCNVSVSTTFDTDTYNLNGSISGAIQINSNNVVLDCSGSTIQGNLSTLYVGIFVSGLENITIKNCNFEKYQKGIWTESPSVNRRVNITIMNNTFDNLTIGTGGIINADNFDESLISDNTFLNINYTAIRIHSTDNTLVENNIVNITGDNFAGIFNDGRNNNISHNVFYLDNDNTVALRIEQDGANDMSNNLYLNNTINGNGSGFGHISTEFNFDNAFVNNTFYNLFRGMEALYNNTLVQGNNFTDCQRAITMASIDRNNTISSNNIVGGIFSMRIVGSQDNTITLNNISDTTNTAFFMDTNANNTFSFNSFTNVVAQYKTFNTGATIKFENITLSETVKDITNNIFLYTATSSSRNQFNVTLAPNQEIQVQDYSCTVPFDSFNFVFGNLCSGTSNNTDWQINKTSDFVLFQSNNANNVNINISSGLTNALIFNTNGSIYGSSTISENDGNINITLPPNNSTFVLDNFNLTEGITRTNSPLGFSSSSRTIKRITSSLTDTITATVIVNIPQSERLIRISYTSDTGTFTQIFSRSDITFSGNTAQITIVGIEPATSSNVLRLVYGCSATERSTLIAIKIFASLAIVIFSITMFFKDGKMNALNGRQIIMVFVGIIIGVVMVSVIADSLFSYCGV